MELSFKLGFNNGRQWISIFIWYSPKEFNLKFGDCIGIYIYDPESRKPRVGEFGQIHLLYKHVDEELVSHELLHFLIDLVRTRNGTINPRNEEKIVSEYGLLIKKFWKRYRRLEER